MKIFITTICTMCLLCFSCDILVNPKQETKPHAHKSIVINTHTFFPFKDNNNWWRFTESSGNNLDIEVTDTISDDNIMYYRVSFREHQVDTTDDWFRQINRNIQFGSSLSGTYNQFLPSQLNSYKGKFLCGADSVKYTYHDSLNINGNLFHNLLILKYNSPMLHGFEEIILAESLGIIQLKDYDGRWIISYEIDSCKIDGTISRY